MSDEYVADFEARSARYAAKSKALQGAQQLCTVAKMKGQMLGTLLALPSWFASGAPWWAIPIFVIVGAWSFGKVNEGRTFRKLAKLLNSAYPELNL